MRTYLYLLMICGLVCILILKINTLTDERDAYKQKYEHYKYEYEVRDYQFNMCKIIYQRGCSNESN